MRCLIILLALLALAILPGRALPDPKTGGKAGAPPSVLVILGYGGTHEFALDPEVAKDLAAKGCLVRTVDDREPLTADYLRQFNAVVVVGLRDFNGGGYYSVGGINLLNTARNIALLQQYVQDGGGLLFVPVMAGAGSEVAETCNAALAPFKLRIGWEAVVDDANRFAAKELDNYAWTKNITAHPITAGVKALAYPTQVMRWDDAYPLNPVMPADPAWQVLVRGEATSFGARYVNRVPTPAEAGKAPALAAVRQAGKGRVAVIGLGGFYLLTHAFAGRTDAKGKPLANQGEATTGFIDGIAYRNGDGRTPSDWGLLFTNTLRWLSEGSAAAGMGGTPAAWETKLGQVGFPDDPVPDFAAVNWQAQQPPVTWTHHLPNVRWWRGMAFYDEVVDPLARGPQRPCKVLIGAHSAYSDGKGSIADWAKAAKAAGFQAVVFTERFEALKVTDWSKVIEDCKANSTPEIACLQGIDISDAYGNRFLLLGNTNLPSGGMLTKDGKGLEMTARLSLGFSGHIAVAHRLGNNPTLPKELIRHFQAITIYTYAPGKRGAYALADDAFAAYTWHLDNASNPVPMAVHELFDPKDVKTDGLIGFQQIVPAQDGLDAVRYFRYGMQHFFENPQRYYITEGPLIDGWSIFNKDIGYAELNRDHFRATVGASSPDPKATIKEAVLYDRGTLSRRWTPNKPAFMETIEGEHGYQRYYMLVVTDSKGRRAISPHLRTVTRGYYTRCADRQNWFGAAGSYTGIWPSGTHGIWYITPSVPAGAETETFSSGTGNPLASKMSLPFASNALTFTDFTIDCKYLSPTHYGMDAWRIENAIPTVTYAARMRVGKWHDVETGLTIANGNLSKLTTVEATLTLKKALPATAGVFPAINTTNWPTAIYVYTKDGQRVEGKLDGKATTILDLPAGAHIGDFMLLAPMAVSGNGAIGWRAEIGKEVPAGAAFKAAYIYLPREWRAELGAEGTPPWSLQLTQGTANALGVVNMTAKNYGVAGTLKAGGALKNLPLQVTGLNGNWPAALWTADGLAYQAWSGLMTPQPLDKVTTAGAPFLAHIGICDGAGYAALPNKDGRFYVGNTLMASDPALVLNYALWTENQAIIEVNNPTDKPITARITSAPIPGKAKVEATVTVPAGSSTQVTVVK